MLNLTILSMVFAALLLSAQASAEGGFSFQGLGDLPGGVFESFAYGVNHDGTVIVGSSRSGNGAEAYRWTENGGMVPLGDLSGGAFSSGARGVSANGMTLAGDGMSAAGSEVFRWTQADGLVSIGDLPGGAVDCRLANISADGLAIGAMGTIAMGERAVLWTAGDGLQNLGLLPGASNSRSNGVSNGASRVVGNSGLRAFTWTASGGMVELPQLSGATRTEASALTPGGNIIVGLSGSEAVRWVNGSLESLGRLGDFASLASVSADGNVASGMDNNRPILWTKSLGIVYLDEYLADHGATTWDNLSDSCVVSGDGQTLAGHSLNPLGDTEAWRATLGFDGTCNVRSYLISKGTFQSGTLKSFRKSDTNRFSIFGDDITLQAEIILEGYSRLSDPNDLQFTLQSRVGRAGVSQQVDLYDFANARFISANGIIAPTADSSITVHHTSNIGRFVGPDGLLRARVTWMPINDDDPFQDGWFHSINLAKWTVAQ